MPLKPENAILRDKITAGIKKAIQKLYEERAAKNETVVVSINGEVKHVPAKDLLKKYQK
jgi:hypothetical protein